MDHWMIITRTTGQRQVLPASQTDDTTGVYRMNESKLNYIISVPLSALAAVTLANVRILFRPNLF